MCFRSVGKLLFLAKKRSPVFSGNTLFSADKKENVVFQKLSIFPAWAGFKPITCGQPSCSATRHMSSASLQWFCALTRILLRKVKKRKKLTTTTEPNICRWKNFLCGKFWLLDQITSWLWRQILFSRGGCLDTYSVNFQWKLELDH